MPKISDLTAATAIDADDLLYVVEDGSSRKATIPQIMEVSALGWGQSWQDVLASRAVSTSYQNTTGRPIMVNVRYVGASGVVTFQISSNGTDWVTVSDNDTTPYGSHSSVVPNGHFYRINGSASISIWAELR